MNFGESLAYWYFRLNGFFIVRNFVIHRGEERTRQPADVDLLGVRFPHVYEEVGGQKSDWDIEVFEEWGIPLNESIVCVFVEVKTGAVSTDDLKRSFSLTRLEYSLQRTGIIPKDQVANIAHDLNAAPMLSIEIRDEYARHISISKILVSDIRPPDKFSDLCFCLPLVRLNVFLDTRLTQYIDRKRGERLYFPDDLIQYAIWLQENSGTNKSAS